MIIKGKARSDGLHLANYLTHDAKKQNDHIGIVEIRHGSAKNLHQALFDMDIATERTKRGKKGLYHAQVNPAYGEDRQMSKADWLKAADTLEEELGFTGQNRVIVLHEKKGRVHGHVVWQREKDGKLIGISHNYLKHDQAREKLEKTLDHKRTLQPKDNKQALSMLWHNSVDGQDFITKAEAMGYKIAKGERRAYSALTPDGKKIDLVRNLDQVKTHQAKAKLKDVEQSLPHENELGGQQPTREKQNEKNRRSDKIPQRKKADQGKDGNSQARQQQTARTAAENFADTITDHKRQKSQTDETQREQVKREQTARTAAENFADTTQNKKQEFKADAKEATQAKPSPDQERQEKTREAANDNSNDIQMTETEKRLKEIMENMRSRGRRRKL